MVWVYSKKGFVEIIGERVKGKDNLTSIMISPIKDEILMVTSLWVSLRWLSKTLGKFMDIL